MTPVLLDVESRSRADLKSVGGRLYWQHPSTQALVVVWYDTADGSVGVWYPGRPWPHAGRVLAAHNAHGFDRFAAERYDFAAGGWIDTAQLARKAGLPGALDALGERWCNMPKDAVASKFTRSLSSVRRPSRKHGKDEISTSAWASMPAGERRTRGVLPELTEEGFARVVRYCASDVEIMARAWPRLEPWLRVDADACALDRVINDRGVAFDSALARRLLAEDARLVDAAMHDAAAALGCTPTEARAAAMSPAQFTGATGSADATKATVAEMTHPLATARRALASIARGKLTAGLTRVGADGRMRDTLAYYGAHTGRWSGKGMQLQNMPRPEARFEDTDVDALADDVLAGRPCDAEEIALLVRATIMAEPGHVLVASDFASIEARATAWAAGDTAALDVFRGGRDPYKVAAVAIFRVGYDDVSKPQRQVGKAAELACGYQGGPGAFERFAAVYRIDLAGLDTQAIVHAWRDLHRPIMYLWKACARAFSAAVQGGASWAGPFEFVRAEHDDAIACFLASRRPIVYHEPQIDERGGLSYRGHRGREHIYGGKLVENAVQGLCRDLMVGAMLRAERAGLPVVLTVHDEIVCEVPEARAESAAATLHEAMVTLPAWAHGFPVGAAGWVGRRYRKG